MIEFLKSLVTGMLALSITILVFIFVIWGIIAGILNYPAVTVALLFILCSIGVGYDIRRSKK